MRSDVAIAATLPLMNRIRSTWHSAASIRLRRHELGMSQDQLAQKIGITFQQVQKYEHGTNRVSFSRLVEIAEALKCGFQDIIGELDQTKAAPKFSQQVARLNAPGVAERMEAYASISYP